jgi:exodeoxyribonuclease VII large subunit
MSVQAHGNISLYEAGGQYQLYIDQVRSTGEGALYMEFLRLKARLEAEGLFDPERKRPIPTYPHRIGIVTSPTGAALQDMLHCLQRRFPLVEVIVAPTPVQGTDAPQGIADAIRALNQNARPDVILVARGGGSIEDLWAFNDEQVAYAIHTSKAPVITGVGHETDFTIADFVADLRAPTPTAAAELCTPDRMELREALGERVIALARVYEKIIEYQRWSLTDRSSRLTLYSPQRQIREHRQRLDDLLRAAGQAVQADLRLKRSNLAGSRSHLGAVNPLAVLDRGYAIVTLENDGSIVRSVTQVHSGDSLKVRVSDGVFTTHLPDPPNP